jgi:hypothetical protein
MAYIGKNLVGILKEQKTVDTMTGDGSDTTLTLSDTPGSVNNVLVFFDGIRQTPITDYTLMGTTLTFTTAPEASVNVVAISGNWSGVVPKMGSVTSSKIVDGMVMDANIVTGVASSKLTGALPAISGANLTGIVSDTGITTNASDPTISTNPAGGLGTVWANSTSGEMYVLTDATAGANVWINVGAGSGDVEPWQLGGTISGYTTGGEAAAWYNQIDKFSFTSDSDATDVGDITFSTSHTAGSSSTTHGYSSGSQNPITNIIQKFSFTVDGNSTDIADLTNAIDGGSGTSSQTHGYCAGGRPVTSVINKFPFATDTNATNIGNLTVSRQRASGQSSANHGYASGGHDTPYYNTIDKYTFASDANATDVGNLLSTIATTAGQSSSTHGYVSGGYPPSSNVIQKFSFSTDGNSTDVGDMTLTRFSAAGQSSTSNGYSSGGLGAPGPGPTNTIDKFTFASDANATDVGNLTVARGASSGQQI